MRPAICVVYQAQAPAPGGGSWSSSDGSTAWVIRSVIFRPTFAVTWRPTFAIIFKPFQTYLQIRIETHIQIHMNLYGFHLILHGFRELVFVARHNGVGGRRLAFWIPLTKTKQQNKQRKTTHRQGSRATHKQTFNKQPKQNGGDRLGTRRYVRHKTKTEQQNKTDPPITPGGRGSGPSLSTWQVFTWTVSDNKYNEIFPLSHAVYPLRGSADTARRILKKHW